MVDLVIGVVKNYEYSKIRCWIQSLKLTGFNGDIVLITNNVPVETQERLISEHGVQILVDESIVDVYGDRFYSMWKFLRCCSDKYRFVISTDIRDVIFQRNPFEWIENNIGNKDIIAVSESIVLRDEEWGRNTTIATYGQEVYLEFKNNLVYNAGVISGRASFIKDLFLSIYLVYRGFITGVKSIYGGSHDQASLNIILNTQPYQQCTLFVGSEVGYTAQLATTGSQIYNKHQNFLVEPIPVYNSVTNLYETSNGSEFYIVHQYDRIPNGYTKKYF